MEPLQMRNLFIAIVAIAAAAVLIPPATNTWAQAPIERQTPPQTSPVNLTLEQRHVIKELIKDSKIANAPADIHLAVGAKVPESVKAQPMPQEIGAKVSQVKSHLVFLQGMQVVIVDPKDKTVVDVID